MQKRFFLKPDISPLLLLRGLNKASLILMGVGILNINTGSEDLINKEIKSATEDFGKDKDISVTVFGEVILQIMQ